MSTTRSGNSKHPRDDKEEDKLANKRAKQQRLAEEKEALLKKKAETAAKARATRKLHQAEKQAQLNARISQYQLQDFHKFLESTRKSGAYTPIIMQAIDAQFPLVPVESREFLKKAYFGGMTPLVNELIKISRLAKDGNSYTPAPELTKIHSALQDYYKYCSIIISKAKTEKKITYSLLCPIPKEIATKLGLQEDLQQKLPDTSLTPLSWFKYAARGHTILLSFHPFEQMREIINDFWDVPPLVSQTALAEEKIIMAAPATLPLVIAAPEEKIALTPPTLSQLVEKAIREATSVEEIRQINKELSEHLKRVQDMYSQHKEKTTNLIKSVKAKGLDDIKHVLTLISGDTPEPQLLIEAIDKILKNLNTPESLSEFQNLLTESPFFEKFGIAQIPFLRLFIYKDVIDKKAFNIRALNVCPIYSLALAKKWDLLNLLLVNDMVEKESLNYSHIPGGDTVLTLIIKKGRWDSLMLISNLMSIDQASLTYDYDCHKILIEASKNRVITKNTSAIYSFKEMYDKLAPVAPSALSTLQTRTIASSYASSPSWWTRRSTQSSYVPPPPPVPPIGMQRLSVPTAPIRAAILMRSTNSTTRGVLATFAATIPTRVNTTAVDAVAIPNNLVVDAAVNTIDAAPAVDANVDEANTIGAADIIDAVNNDPDVADIATSSTPVNSSVTPLQKSYAAAYRHSQGLFTPPDLSRAAAVVDASSVLRNDNDLPDSDDNFTRLSF